MKKLERFGIRPRSNKFLVFSYPVVTINYFESHARLVKATLLVFGSDKVLESVRLKVREGMRSVRVVARRGGILGLIIGNDCV